MSQSQQAKIAARVAKKPALKNIGSSKKIGSSNTGSSKNTASKPPRPTPSSQSKNAALPPRTPSLSQASSRKRHRQVIESEEEDDETEEEEAGRFDKSRRVSSSSNTTVGQDADAELDALDNEEHDLEVGEAGENNALAALASVRSKKKKQQTPKAHRDVVFQRQSNLSQDVKGCFIQLENTCRIMFLCDFSLVVHEIIKSVWSDQVKTSDWEWEESASRIGWNGANWKKRAISNMERRIREYKRADVDEENGLHTISQYKDLALFFASKYSASSFTAVFDFVDGCIDIAETTERSPECRTFFKTIFANFATKVKLYMDWNANPERTVQSPASRPALLLWFNKMAMSDRFKNVNPSMFVRLEGRKRERNSNLDRPADPDNDKDYVFFDQDDQEDAAATAADAANTADAADATDD